MSSDKDSPVENPDPMLKDKDHRVQPTCIKTATGFSEPVVNASSPDIPLLAPSTTTQDDPDPTNKSGVQILMNFDLDRAVDKKQPDLSWKDEDYQVQASCTETAIDPWDPVVNTPSPDTTQSTPGAANQHAIDPTTSVINKSGGQLNDAQFDNEEQCFIDPPIDPYEAEVAARDAFEACLADVTDNGGDDSFASSVDVGPQFGGVPFDFADDEAMDESSLNNDFNIDLWQYVDIDDEVDLVDYDEEIQQSPWQREVSEQYDAAEQQIVLRANEKATEIIEYLDYNNTKGREKAFDYLVELFKEYKYPNTYKAILEVAKNGPDLDMLQAVVELRSIWNNKNSQYVRGIKNTLPISWDVSYLICQYRSEYPPESMIDDDWVKEWFNLPFDRDIPGTRTGFIQFLLTKVTNVESEMFATLLRLNYYYDNIDDTHGY